MSTLVVDASVAVKWALPETDGEEDVAQALALLTAFQRSKVNLLQPPHWLAEVTAVIARLRPEIAAEATTLFHTLDLPVADDLEVYLRGCTLATELHHHLFDTLYHAVALEKGATFVTADTRYWRKARSHGAIRLLRELDLGGANGP